MATVSEIIKRKGSHVFSIGKSATVLEAAKLMNEHQIGCLVVISEGRVEGIFTERDVLRRVVAAKRDPATTPVEQVMTKDVACAGVEMHIDEVRGIFRNYRIRHLPVINDDQKMIGLISIGDLNAHLAGENETTIRYLHEYLYGTV